MNYFENLPIININDEEFRNLFHRVLITYVKDEQISTYQWKDGDTLPLIAYRLYGSAQLWWVLALLNDIRDINYDMPLTTQQIEDIASETATYYQFRDSVLGSGQKELNAGASEVNVDFSNDDSDDYSVILTPITDSIEALEKIGVSVGGKITSVAPEVFGNPIIGYNDYDNFGSCIALANNSTIMAVGAPRYDSGFADRGGVYIFDWVGSSWVQRGSVLLALDAGKKTNDHFGSAVAFDSTGNVLIVGSKYRTGTSNNRGAVYTFDWNGSTWIQRGSALIASDYGSGDRFGGGVSLSSDGNILVVGAHRWDGAGGTDQGVVYIFDRNGTSWTERTNKIISPVAAANDNFGISVSLSSNGSKIVVGAYGVDSAAGAVYIFNWDGTSNWIYEQVISGAAPNICFGYSVHLHSNGDVLCVGASNYPGPLSSPGGVFIYDLVDGLWVKRDYIIVSEYSSKGDSFGRSVYMSDDYKKIVCGAELFGNYESGSVYFFMFPSFNTGYGYQKINSTSFKIIINGAINEALSFSYAIFKTPSSVEQLNTSDYSDYYTNMLVEADDRRDIKILKPPYLSDFITYFLLILQNGPDAADLLMEGEEIDYNKETIQEINSLKEFDDVVIPDYGSFVAMGDDDMAGNTSFTELDIENFSFDQQIHIASNPTTPSNLSDVGLFGVRPFYVKPRVYNSGTSDEGFSYVVLSPDDASFDIDSSILESGIGEFTIGSYTTITLANHTDVALTTDVILMITRIVDSLNDLPDTGAFGYYVVDKNTVRVYTSGTKQTRFFWCLVNPVGA